VEEFDRVHVCRRVVECIECVSVGNVRDSLVVRGSCSSVCDCMGVCGRA